jgi:HTH-like domain
MIGLAGSTFYHKPKISREQRERDDAELRDEIERVQSEFPRAGYRRVQVYLRRGGRHVGERRLRRVMRKFCLHAEIRRAFIVTTDSKHGTACIRTCYRVGGSPASTRRGPRTSPTSASAMASCIWR